MGIFYAGPGTLWTDLKGFEQAMLGKLASDARDRGSSAKQMTKRESVGVGTWLSLFLAPSPRPSPRWGEGDGIRRAANDR